MIPSSPSRTRTEPFSYSPLMTAWTGKFSMISLALAAIGPVTTMRASGTTFLIAKMIWPSCSQLGEADSMKM